VASADRTGKQGKPPRCPRCGRPMEFCEFPVLLITDDRVQAEPPLWLCRGCWKVLPHRADGVRIVGQRRT